MHPQPAQPRPRGIVHHKDTRLQAEAETANIDICTVGLAAVGVRSRLKDILHQNTRPIYLRRARSSEALKATERRLTLSKEMLQEIRREVRIAVERLELARSPVAV
jgi:hypothetical protein